MCRAKRFEGTYQILSDFRVQISWTFVRRGEQKEKASTKMFVKWRAAEAFGEMIGWLAGQTSGGAKDRLEALKKLILCGVIGDLKFHI